MLFALVVLIVVLVVLARRACASLFFLLRLQVFCAGAKIGSCLTLLVAKMFKRESVELRAEPAFIGGPDTLILNVTLHDFCQARAAGRPPKSSLLHPPPTLAVATTLSRWT